MINIVASEFRKPPRACPRSTARRGRGVAFLDAIKLHLYLFFLFVKLFSLSLPSPGSLVSNDSRKKRELVLEKRHSCLSYIDYGKRIGSYVLKRTVRSFLVYWYTRTDTKKLDNTQQLNKARRKEKDNGYSLCVPAVHQSSTKRTVCFRRCRISIKIKNLCQSAQLCRHVWILYHFKPELNSFFSTIA